jgi:signal transduction histidine kinase
MAEVTQPRLQEFVATVSHELRSPLTSLQATLELLEEEALSGAADTAQAVIYVEIALRQTRRLIKLATDLLDVSRLDGDAPPALHRIEVSELAQMVRRVTIGSSTDGEHVLVAVADEGPGTASDEREHIFGRFVRGSAAAGAPAGAGSALSLARGLARAMGGELEVAPVPLGARFVVTLPAEGDA